MPGFIAKRLGSLYIDVLALRPGTAGAYARAFVSSAVATVVQMFIEQWSRWCLVWSAGELANGHVLDHATTQRADGFCGLVEVMGGSLRLEC